MGSAGGAEAPKAPPPLNPPLDKVHDIHKYNVTIVGSDSKPVAYLDHLLDIL